MKTAERNTLSDLDPMQRELHRLAIKSLTRDDIETRLLTPANREAWKLPAALTVHKFLVALVNAKVLDEARLEFPSRNYIRYLWGDPSPYEVAKSVNREGYFSHFKAMHLNGLTDQFPKTIYLNVEQQMSPGGGTLDQGALHRTFQRPCRVTHNTGTYGNLKISLLNGGNTRKLGVINVALPDANAEVRSTLNDCLPSQYSCLLMSILKTRATHEIAQLAVVRSLRSGRAVLWRSACGPAIFI